MRAASGRSDEPPPRRPAAGRVPLRAGRALCDLLPLGGAADRTDPAPGGVVDDAGSAGGIGRWWPGRAEAAVNAPADLPDAAHLSEQAVLGTALLYPEAVALCRAADLQAADFADHGHRAVWSALDDLQRRGELADAVAVFAALQARGHADLTGGLVYLNELTKSALSAQSAAAHARRIHDAAQRRIAAQVADRLAAELRRPGAELGEAVRAGVEELRGLTAGAGSASRLRYVAADAIATEEQRFDDELVEGVIGRQAMAVLYGDSNSGKTFLAIDICAHVASGRDWMGRRTRRGVVLYVACEAPGSVRQRVAAWRRVHDEALSSLLIVESPINLFDGDAGADALVALIAEVEALCGEPIALVVVDTLARVAAGANENSGQDMGRVLARAEAIRAAAGAALLFVHHTGKDAAKGARGWSGLRAAIDTEIEVTADEASGDRVAEVTKQRDLPGKGTRIGFRLDVVPMGVNAWGAPRSTCVVLPADAPPRVTRRRESATAGAIVEFLTARKSGCLLGAMVKHFEGRIHRGSVYREVNRMVEEGTLIRSGKVVALPGLPGPR